MAEGRKRAVREMRGGRKGGKEEGLFFQGNLPFLTFGGSKQGVCFHSVRRMQPTGAEQRLGGGADEVMSRLRQVCKGYMKRHL